MAFLLEPGDVLGARPLAAGDAAWGDLVVAPAAEGRLPTVHRLIWKGRSAGRWRLRTKGDFAWRLDAPIAADSLQQVAWARTASGWMSFESRWALALGVAIGFYSGVVFLLLESIELAFLGIAAAAARLGGGAGRATARFVDRWTLEARAALAARLGIPARALRRLIERRGGPARTDGRAVLEGRVRDHRRLCGEVVIRGDVVIEEGASVTVEAGSRVSFDPRGSGLRSLLRPSPGGWRPVTDALSANCIVFGRLRLAGADGRPVAVDAGEAGGFVLAGRGEARFEHAAFGASGGRPEGRRTIVCVDEARADFADCRFRGLSTAVWTFGRSRLRLERCAIEECAEGLAAHGGRVAVSAGRFAACGRAVVLGGGGRVRLRGSELDAGEAGVSVQRGTVRLDECVVRAARGPALWIDGPRSRARSTRSAFERSPQGVALRGDGAWSSTEDAFRDCEEGVHLTGGSQDRSAPAVTLESAVLERCGIAVLAEGKRALALAGARIRSAGGLGLAVREGGRVSGSLDVSGASVGVEVSGRGHAELSELRVSACAKGVWARGRSRLAVRGGELLGCGLAAEEDVRVAAAGLRVSGAAGCGVGLFGPGRLSLLDASLEDCALEAVAGRTRLRRARLAGRAAALLRGGSHRWADVECAAGGVRLGGDAALLARELRVSGADHGLWVQEAARVRLERGALADCGTGLLVEGDARAELSGTRLARAAREGAWVRGRARLLGSVEAASCAGVGVRLSEQGRLELERGSFDGNGGGLEALGGASVLRDVVFNGNRAAGATLKGGAHRWERAACSGSAVGVGVYGDASLEASELDAAACDHGVWVQDGARARLERGTLRACGTGVLAEGRSETELRGLRVLEASREGIWTRASARLRGSFDAAACGGAGLRISDEARAALEGGRLEANGAGIEASGGSSRARGTILEGNRLAGASLKGGTHRWERVRCAGSAIGAGVYGRAALSAAALEAAGCGHGVWLQDEARVRLEGGTISGCGTGLLAEGASAAELDATRVAEASREGVWVRARARIAGAFDADGCAGPGLRATDEAVIELRGGAFERNGSGIEAAAGGSRLADVRLVNNRLTGLRLRGGTHRAERVRCAGSEAGVSAGLDAEAVFVALEAAGCARGVRVEDRARVSLRGAVLDGCGVGLLVEGDARAGASDVRVSRAASHGVWARDRAQVDGTLHASRSAAAGVFVTDRAAVRLERGELRDNEVGLQCDAGSVSLDGAALEGNRRAGVVLAGGAHSLLRVRVAGSPQGVSLHGRASAAIVSCDITAGTGVVGTAGSRCRILETRIAGGETGVWLQERARASIVDAAIEGQARYGARMSQRSRALVAGTAFARNAVIALLLEDRADARASTNRLELNPTAFKADGESRLRLTGNAIRRATTDALWRSAAARVTEAAPCPDAPRPRARSGSRAP